MRSAPRRLALAVVMAAIASPSAALAAPQAGPVAGEHRSITDRTVEVPTWAQWRRLLLLEDYNTRVVLLGTTLLGLAAGAVGNFTLLRKRALMGDALSHAMLPGVGLAFVLVTLGGGDGKSLPLLLAGAALTGVLGLAAILFIRNATRLKEDAALGIVLSVFFGAGIAVLGVAHQMKTGHAAGLESFIYGKAASMGALDAELISIAKSPKPPIPEKMRSLSIGKVAQSGMRENAIPRAQNRASAWRRRTGHSHPPNAMTPAAANTAHIHCTGRERMIQRSMGS